MALSRGVVRLLQFEGVGHLCQRGKGTQQCYCFLKSVSTELQRLNTVPKLFLL